MVQKGLLEKDEGCEVHLGDL